MIVDQMQYAFLSDLLKVKKPVNVYIRCTAVIISKSTNLSED